MSNTLLQILPFTSAAASLVGRTLNVKALQQNASVLEVKGHLVTALIDVFTLGAVCAVAAQAGIEGGVLKGAILGTLTAGAAFVVPRLYMPALLGKRCGSCTPWGKLGLGGMLLLAMFVGLAVVHWLFFYTRA